MQHQPKRTWHHKTLLQRSSFYLNNKVIVYFCFQGHIGRCVWGIGLLHDENIIPEIIKLAEESGVFSVRGWVMVNGGFFNTYTAKPVCWNGLISNSYCRLKPLCSGMGEVVPARTSPTLLPPSPRTVLSLSCFKVSQCINCRDWHCKS